MSTTIRSTALACAAAAMLASGFLACIAAQDSRAAQQQLVRDIYEELIEINTVTDTGDTARAADAMAARLLAAGFAENDVRVFKPTARKGNLVARLRGTGERRPLLLMAHLDVVEARREDWSTDPFELLEKDGYFYARGSRDDKFMAASFVANLIRFKQAGQKLARDLILVLETDEETFDRDGHGIQYLLSNQRELLDAELAINEGGTVGALNNTAAFVAVQTWEKVPANFVFETRNTGGHSSQPRKDNAIYQLASALTKLAALRLPVALNDITRSSLEVFAMLQPPQVREDLQALLANTADAAAMERLSTDPLISATIRTTCVATLLEAGHAFNALPQTARATVNCRLLPGESPDDTLAALQAAVADDQVSITLERAHVPSDPSALTPELMQVFSQLRDEFWPAAPLFPIMSPGASDGSFLRNAGIPTYGVGILTDVTDNRDHGRDERLSVAAFYDGHESLYKLVKLLASSAQEPASRSR